VPWAKTNCEAATAIRAAASAERRNAKRERRMVREGKSILPLSLLKLGE
jgi:hypothetical protein